MHFPAKAEEYDLGKVGVNAKKIYYCYYVIFAIVHGIFVILLLN